MKGRPVSDRDVLPQAMKAMRTVKTAQELRQAQAVAFVVDGVVVVIVIAAGCLGIRRIPDLGLCTAPMLCQGRYGGVLPTPPRGGRRHQNLSIEQEQAVLEPFLGPASTGSVVVVAPVKQSLQARLGQPVTLASMYTLLHRHGWRKVVPDKVHPKADA